MKLLSKFGLQMEMIRHVIDIEEIWNYNIITPFTNLDLGVYKWVDGNEFDGQGAEN